MRDPLEETRQARLRYTRPSCAPGRWRDRRAIPVHRQILWAAVLTLSVISGSPGVAQDISRTQMRGLDEQVQEIKSDVLRIAAELNRLEERLLYPSNTQVSVFVSLAEGEMLRLDSIRIQIDGAFAAQHIYSFKELEALQKGGVQRIYTGNVSTGEHEIEVSYAGKRANGGDFGGTERFRFTKDVEPKLVGITLDGESGVQVGGF